MIWYFILTFFTTLLNILFSPLGIVTSLPTILGVNLDTTLVQAMGTFNTFTTAFWMIGDAFDGALILLGYYGAKMFLRVVMGSRAPGSH